MVVLIDLLFVQTNYFFRYVPIDSYQFLILFSHYVVIYRYISDINGMCSIYCKHMSLLNVESYVFINVLYLVSLCIHVYVDDVIGKKLKGIMTF